MIVELLTVNKIVERLKEYLAFSDQDIQTYFRIAETDQAFVISATKWLEAATFAAARRLLAEYGGTYDEAPKTGFAIFTIPKPKTEQPPVREGSEGVTPECINIDNAKENGDYSLARSMKGKLGQLVPCQADADGVVFDGLHRKKINPAAWTVKLDQVKTAPDKIMARLIANNCRRKYMDEEFHNDVGFLKGAGVSAEEIHEATGIGLRTIYKYMPQELKAPSKVEAGHAGGEAHAQATKILQQNSAALVHQTVTTSDTEKPHGVAEGTHARINHTGLVQCESCGMGVHYPQPFGKFQNLCPQCFERACKNPDEFKRSAEKPKVQAPTEVTEAWKDREAKMHPQHSSMEQAILSRLHGLNKQVQVDMPFCLQSTTPDFYFPNLNIAVYLDGPVHEGREDRDSVLRDLLTKQHGITVMTVPYASFTKEEVERVLNVILESIEP